MKHIYNSIIVGYDGKVFNDISRLSVIHIMKASDIVRDNSLSLSLNDTVAKAINVMYQNKINQIPIFNSDTGKYAGMIFAKEFLNVNAIPDSKLKSFVTNTAVLDGDDSLEKWYEDGHNVRQSCITHYSK